MKRLLLPLILFFLLVLEGVALELLPVKLVAGNFLIVPHWVLVFLLFMAIFYDKENTYFSVLYGVLFGLLIDAVYTGILGVYMFAYALIAYIIHGLKKMLHANIYVTMLLGVLGIALADIAIYFIFLFIEITDIRFVEYIKFRLLPTVIANLLFLLAIYPIMNNRLARWKAEQLSDSDSL